MRMYTMKEWEINMAGSDFWEGMLSKGQVDFIIDECKKSLVFDDYFDAYTVDDGLSSDTTQYLVHVITLLNKMVKAKEILITDED